MIGSKHCSDLLRSDSYVVRLVSQKFPHLSAQAITRRLRYASFVSLEHKLVYVETPKAACTTTKHLLRELSRAKPMEYPTGPHRESRREMFVHLRSNVPLPSIVDLDDRTQFEVLSCPDFLRFCIVRNPYTRILSTWRNKVAPCEPGYEYIYEAMTGSEPPLNGKKIIDFTTFLEFVERESDLCTCNPHWCRQVDLTYHTAIPYTHIGRFERLSDTMEVIGRHISPRKLPRLGDKNTTAVLADDGEMTEATALRLFNLYEADFDAFEYSKESWRGGSRVDNGCQLPLDYRTFKEVVERNLVISHMCKEYARLERRYRATYRLSFARVCDALSRAWRSF